MNRIKSPWFITSLFVVVATFTLSEPIQAEIYTASRAQLAGLTPGHALFIGRDGKMMGINLSGATTEQIVLPAGGRQPDQAQYCAVDPTSHTVLIAILDGVSAQSRLSLYDFGNLKNPRWELPLNLFALQVAWTGRKGEFYSDAVSRSVGRSPGASLILHDGVGGLSTTNAPRLSKAIKASSQQGLVFSSASAGTAALGATVKPDFEKTAEFRALSMGQSPYYHVYLCLIRDGQLTKVWPADSAQAVAFSFDGQTILARYQPPTKDAPPLEMAKFDVKTGRIEKCGWLPPDTLHLLCASDDLNEEIIPVDRGQSSTSPEFMKACDALFADLPKTSSWCVACHSATRPPVLIHAWEGRLDRAFDFAAMTTAPGEFWITDGVTLWHLDDQGHVTEKKLKVK